MIKAYIIGVDFHLVPLKSSKSIVHLSGRFTSFECTDIKISKFFFNTSCARLDFITIFCGSKVELAHGVLKNSIRNTCERDLRTCERVRKSRSPHTSCVIYYFHENKTPLIRNQVQIFSSFGKKCFQKLKNVWWRLVRNSTGGINHCKIFVVVSIDRCPL